jgi:hypothetical protein
MAGMTNLDTKSQTAAGLRARRLSGLRRASLGALVMLVVQFGLGIGVNLYISLPAKGSAGDAFSNGPLLALHVVVGLLLIVAAIGLLVRAIIARHGAVIAAAAVGLLAIATAATQGFSFVSDGTNAASLAMALATGVAMLCYASALYLVRPPAQRA